MFFVIYIVHCTIFQKCLNMKEKNLDSKRRCEHSRLKTLAQRDIVRHGRMHFRATIIQWYFCKKNTITYLLDCQMVNFSLLKLEERVCELDQWLYKKPSPEKKILISQDLFKKRTPVFCSVWTDPKFFRHASYPIIGISFIFCRK